MATPGSHWMRLVRNVMNAKGSKASLDSLAHKVQSLQQLMKQIQAEHFNLETEIAEKDWLYEGRSIKAACIEIEHTKDYNVCIFLLRPYSRIPLHDHPNMHGLMKMLFGKMHIQSYSPLESKSNYMCNGGQSNSISENNHHLPVHTEDSVDLTLYTHKLQDTVMLTPQSTPCVLYPHVGNIHEIEALSEPVAFLDILLPPYNPEQGRDCNYYVRSGASEDRTFVHLEKISDFDHGFYCIQIDHDIGF